MGVKKYKENDKANESISKFKLLSAYGGPGSIVHTSFGCSVIVSCIEEWGFITKLESFIADAIILGKNEDDIFKYVLEQAKLINIGISNDNRLLNSLKERKELVKLNYLALIPDVEIKEITNKIKGDGAELAINSSFMPKVFADKQHNYKTYKEWYKKWVAIPENNQYGNDFFPPKYKPENGYPKELIQDNIVLICEHGHISDFPWSKYLNWRCIDPAGINSKTSVDLFSIDYCCGNENNQFAKIKITSSQSNSSGFDGKRLKCEACGKSVSLKGIMNTKIKCKGHKPWELLTWDSQSEYSNIKHYSGNNNSRNQLPKVNPCESTNPMKVALTTGNNLYYSRILSSIYMPEELFLSEVDFRIVQINREKDEIDNKIDIARKQKDTDGEDDLMEQKLALNRELKKLSGTNQENENVPDSEKDTFFRFQEFRALTTKSEAEINIDKNGQLKVKDVTDKIVGKAFEKYFSKVIRIDNMKITSAQLEFSRVMPIDGDSDKIKSQNIFRSIPSAVEVYPVVENFGEGIFFAFNQELIEEYGKSNDLIKSLNEKLEEKKKERTSFSKGAIDFGMENNWQLYLVHTFCHLIMKELEFRCGYPTASLSERIYVSNEDKYKMYGCMIYTAEGSEGSMGGLIAQTRPKNLENLLTSALNRGIICNSDPLCWESDGQGLFEMNFASCFSCSLISETSCEHRNIYLDRRILVDENWGFFKELI